MLFNIAIKHTQPTVLTYLCSPCFLPVISSIMPPKSAAPKKPTYFALAKEAILALKDRTGSSPQAIKAYITKTHPSVKFARHALTLALKKGVESKKLVKVKGSYKVSAEEKTKKATKPKKKKAIKKKTAPKVKKTPKKKVRSAL